MGDDLALNAQQVAGIKADRELPVVLAVAKGSLKNKLILAPSALAISAFAPWAVIPLLMLGGAYLCYEGLEKLAHKFLHSKAEEKSHHLHLVEALANPAVDMVAFEKDKIQGAVRTDFILSAEIIVITLGTVATAGFGTQVAVLAGIALIMTIGVYGLAAGIVKLDDAGLYLSRKNGRFLRGIGRTILLAAPGLMKGLSIVGTAAMFLVGGGILTHARRPDKTRIGDCRIKGQGFDFLGYRFEAGRRWVRKKEPDGTERQDPRKDPSHPRRQPDADHCRPQPDAQRLVWLLQPRNGS